MLKSLSNGIIGNNCGIGHASVFRNNSDYGNDLKKFNPAGGAGWLLASFTTELPDYKEAYEVLKKRFKIVFQSPVRKNKRTNHQFFFCIYDTSKDKS